MQLLTILGPSQSFCPEAACCSSCSTGCGSSCCNCCSSSYCRAQQHRQGRGSGEKAPHCQQVLLKMLMYIVRRNEQYNIYIHISIYNQVFIYSLSYSLRISIIDTRKGMSIQIRMYTDVDIHVGISIDVDLKIDIKVKIYIDVKKI